MRAVWLWASAALVAGLAIFLFAFQRRFEFDPVVVGFGVAAFTAFLSGIFLAGFFLSYLGRTAAGLLIATCLFVLTAGTASISAAAYFSNALWGDGLTYSLAKDLLHQRDAVLTFFPLSAGAETAIMSLGVGIAAVVLAMTALVCLWLARAFLSEARRQHALYMLGGMFGMLLLAGGTAVAIYRNSPKALRGEPLLTFFEVFAPNPVGLDPGRVAALAQDEAAFAAYPRDQAFNRKNVIVIFSDSLRPDHMGVYGYDRETTPFLSKLSREGHLYRADMAVSTCADSFCGIASTMSSRPFAHISNRSLTVYRLLNALGYRSEFYLSGNHAVWYYLKEFYGSDADAVYDFKSDGGGRGRSKSADRVNDDETVLRAMQDHLSPSDGIPRFLYFFLMSSHSIGKKYPAFDLFKPSDFSKADVKAVWNKMIESAPGSGKPQPRISEEGMTALRNRYDNGVLQADDYIRRIFETLDAKGYLKNSMVVILADHGDGMGEHGHIGHVSWLYQEHIRIPLMIFDSDGIARYRNDRFATQIDVAPTIAAGLGLAMPSSWEGKSLTEAPAARTTIHQTRSGLCFALLDYEPSALSKYIRCKMGGGIVREELFDLTADPHETDNLARTAPDTTLEPYRREIDSRFQGVITSCGTGACVH